MFVKNGFVVFRSATSRGTLCLSITVVRPPSVDIRLQVASFSSAGCINMGLLRFAAASARSGGVCSSISTWSPLQDAPLRLFTSKSEHEEPARKNEGDNVESSSPPPQLGELLYARAANRAMVPRGLLAMTTLHTSYWLGTCWTSPRPSMLQPPRRMS